MNNADEDEELSSEEAQRVFDWVLKHVLNGENIPSDLKSEMAVHFLNCIDLPGHPERECEE